MDGILLIDKPAGLTSHDVVFRVRRAAGERAVGHCGTLDPMATGLLVVLLGRATRLSAWLTLDRKRYLATVRFGSTTETLDAEGKVFSYAPPGTALPSREAVLGAVARRVGPMAQVPPAVSAIKVGGVAMHERARRGETVELAARDVTLERAEVLATREGECDLDLSVSKGFYVRSFARDLAGDLGTLGHLTALRRTESGSFSLADALGADVLQRAAQRDESARQELRDRVRPFQYASKALRTITVDDETSVALGHGKRPACEGADGTVLVFDAKGEAVCVATLTEGVLTVARGLR